VVANSLTRLPRAPGSGTDDLDQLGVASHGASMLRIKVETRAFDRNRGNQGPTCFKVRK
jgi:hypothetical protein